MSETSKNKARKKKEEVYLRERERHPGGCYGVWVWIKGTPKVFCQNCGYTMEINWQSMQLEHLPMDEAVRNCLELQDPKTLAGDWK